MDHVECGYRRVGLEQTQAMGASGCWKFEGGSCIEPLKKSPGICVHLWGFWDLGCVSHFRFSSVLSCLCSIGSCTCPFYNKRLHHCEPGADLSCHHSSLALAFLINDGGGHSPARFAPLFLPVCCWHHKDDPVLQSPSLEVIDPRYRVSSKLSHIISHHCLWFFQFMSHALIYGDVLFIHHTRILQMLSKTWYSFRTLNLAYEIFADIEVWVTGQEKWSRDYDHILLLQSLQVQVPASLLWVLTAVCNSSSEGSDVLFWPLLALHTYVCILTFSLRDTAL